MTEHDEYPAPRSRIAARLVWTFLGLLAVLVVVAVVGALLRSDEQGDPGQVDEVLYGWGGAFPSFVDVTAAWGVDDWAPQPPTNFAGAVAIGDLDGDGRNDIVVAAGSVAIYFGTETGFEPSQSLGARQLGDAVAVGLGDIDEDGWLDIILGRSAPSDLVFWGGLWAKGRNPADATVTDLPSGDASTGFAVADLNGDDVRDIVRIGYGSPRGRGDDVIFLHDGARRFERLVLPNSDGLSLALEVGDFDDDGLNDVWVTRDVGWLRGGDSVYSRQGVADGEWADVAATLGVALEIEGMSITIADLSGDGRLDAYLSDLGDNEFLVASGAGFAASSDHGAAYIRPGEAAANVVSSSWGSGVGDFNLDGVLDIAVANGAFPGMDNKVPDTEVSIMDRPALFLGAGDGTYSDVWPSLGLERGASWRGLAVGDLDRDGDADLALVDHGGGLVLYRNEATQPSLTIRQMQQGCAIAGTVVRVEVGDALFVAPLVAHGSGGRHASEIIVGAGQASTARVVVTLPGQEDETHLVSLNAPRTTFEVPCQ